MLQPATLKFLTSLTKNNDKAWFDEHRDSYQEAKEDVEQLVDSILQAMTPLEPALGEQKAKNCVFRIFRDVRFSKDKTPYKTHFGAYFSKGGRKFPGAGYYLHIEPGKSFAAGGIWMPEPALLKAVRQEIDYNLDEFLGIANGKEFKKLFGKIDGEQLKNLPQGYEADNPAAMFLKFKSFTVSSPVADKDITGKALVSKCVQRFSAMKGLVDFLNRGMDLA
jgi:uncharacterized protein (TIGR02453 family)